MRETAEVTVAFFGDGAISEGAYHEAMHLAGLWDLPLIGVIENNQYAEMTPIEAHHPEESLNDLTIYGEPYGLRRERVDGMDPEAVFEATTAAVEHARAGDGPSLIECVSARFKGHHQDDEETYRSEDDLAEWKEKDPVDMYPKRLIEDGVLKESEVENLRERLRAEIEAAVEFARESPFPEPEAAYDFTMLEGQ
jgi:pyruvate dehydrogenase E1 component alpha subunit